MIISRIMLAIIVSALLIPTTTTAQSKSNDPAKASKSNEIVKFVRQRLNVPASMQVELAPLQDSDSLLFYKSIVTAKGTTTSKSINILWSKDDRFLIIGDLYHINVISSEEVVQDAKKTLGFPESAGGTLDPVEPSVYSEFYKAAVHLKLNNQDHSQPVYFTPDKKSLIVGMLFPVNASAREEILKSIVVEQQPAEGPKNAPVTIIEFADLQCPSCAKMDAVLQKEVLPKYAGKIRIIFKDFPQGMHRWAMAASLASQCIFQERPDRLATWRSLVFENQNRISAENPQESLLQLASQASVDATKLPACMDSPTTRERVEQNIQEGVRLEIGTTPTFYINGRVIVGLPETDYLEEVIEEALYKKSPIVQKLSPDSCSCDLFGKDN